jgi:hypothetical protein
MCMHWGHVYALGGAHMLWEVRVHVGGVCVGVCVRVVGCVYTLGGVRLCLGGRICVGGRVHALGGMYTQMYSLCCSY